MSFIASAMTGRDEARFLTHRRCGISMQDKGSSLKNDDSISSRKSTSQGFDKGNEADQPIPFGGLALIVLGMLIAAPAGFCTFLIVPRAFTSEAHFPASEYALFNALCWGEGVHLG